MLGNILASKRRLENSDSDNSNSNSDASPSPSSRLSSASPSSKRLHMMAAHRSPSFAIQPTLAPVYSTTALTSKRSADQMNDDNDDNSSSIGINATRPTLSQSDNKRIHLEEKEKEEEEEASTASSTTTTTETSVVQVNHKWHLDDLPDELLEEILCRTSNAQDRKSLASVHRATRRVWLQHMMWRFQNSRDFLWMLEHCDPHTVKFMLFENVHRARWQFSTDMLTPRISAALNIIYSSNAREPVAVAKFLSIAMGRKLFRPRLEVNAIEHVSPATSFFFHCHTAILIQSRVWAIRAPVCFLCPQRPTIMQRPLVCQHASSFNYPSIDRSPYLRMHNVHYPADTSMPTAQAPNPICQMVSITHDPLMPITHIFLAGIPRENRLTRLKEIEDRITRAFPNHHVQPNAIYYDAVTRMLRRIQLVRRTLMEYPCYTNDEMAQIHGPQFETSKQFSVLELRLLSVKLLDELPTDIAELNLPYCIWQEKLPPTTLLRFRKLQRLHSSTFYNAAPIPLLATQVFITDEVIERLAAVKDSVLSTVSLNGHPHVSPAALAKLPALTNLNMEGSAQMDLDALSPVAARLKTLAFTRAGMSRPAALQHLPITLDTFVNLTDLTMGFNVVSGTTFPARHADPIDCNHFVHLKQLRRLVLRNVVVDIHSPFNYHNIYTMIGMNADHRRDVIHMNSEMWTVILSSLPNLTELAGCILRPTKEMFAQLTQLKHLFLHNYGEIPNTPLGDAFTALPQLEILHIQKMDATEMGQNLMQYPPLLRCAVLNGNAKNRLPNKALLNLLNPLASTHLESLSLARHPCVTHDTLAAIARMPLLRQLNVDGCSEIMTFATAKLTRLRVLSCVDCVWLVPGCFNNLPALETLVCGYRDPITMSTGPLCIRNADAQKIRQGVRNSSSVHAQRLKMRQEFGAWLKSEVDENATSDPEQVPWPVWKACIVNPKTNGCHFAHAVALPRPLQPKTDVKFNDFTAAREAPIVRHPEIYGGPVVVYHPILKNSVIFNMLNTHMFRVDQCQPKVPLQRLADPFELGHPSGCTCLLCSEFPVLTTTAATAAQQQITHSMIGGDGGRIPAKDHVGRAMMEVDKFSFRKNTAPMIVIRTEQIFKGVPLDLDHPVTQASLRNVILSDRYFTPGMLPNLRQFKCKNALISDAAMLAVPNVRELVLIGCSNVQIEGVKKLPLRWAVFEKCVAISHKPELFTADDFPHLNALGFNNMFNDTSDVPETRMFAPARPSYAQLTPSNALPSLDMQVNNTFHSGVPLLDLHPPWYYAPDIDLMPSTM